MEEEAKKKEDIVNDVVNDILHKCGQCEYKSTRSDNLDRHLLIHTNARMICECGERLASTSFKRHLSTKKHRKAIESMKFEAEIPNNHLLPTVNNNVDASAPNSTDELCVNIETTIKIRTTPDGQLLIDQSPIKIAGMDFIIVPSHLLSQEN